MKKTYLAPTTEVVKIEQTQMLCMSLSKDNVKSDADLIFGGGIDVDEVDFIVR